MRMRCLAAIAAVVMTGCSTIKQTATSAGDGTHKFQQIEMRVRTLGDAKQVAQALRAQNGATQTLGAQGLEQQSTSQALDVVLQALIQAAAKGVKP